MGNVSSYSCLLQRKASLLVSATMLIAVLLLASVGNAQKSCATERIPVADAHFHLLDFLQNSAYMDPQSGEEVPPIAARSLPHFQSHHRLKLFLRKMDEANVSHAMVSGMPFVKKWSEDVPIRSKYYLDSGARVIRARDTDYVVALSFIAFQVAEPQRYEQEFPRLAPFICGFNETDLGAVDMIAKRITEFPGLWKGIGEVMSRHDDLTNLTTGERSRANHPAMFRIFDFAGEFGLPVSIHHNIGPISPDGSPRPAQYLGEILDVFEEFPQTTFIWAHAGISRRVVIEGLTGILDRYVLTPHHNHVLIDLSWVIFEDYLLDKDHNGNVKRDPASGELRIRQEWIDLIERFPGNFLLGSDKVGDFTGEKYKKEIRKFDPLLDQLKPEVAKQVASLNWLRIVPKKGLTLPEGYKYPEFRYTQRSGPRRVRLEPIRSPDTPAAPWLHPRKDTDLVPAIVP
jgi:hypothetical protein